MGKAKKRVLKHLNSLEQKIRRWELVRGYRKRFSFVLKSRLKNVPEKVSDSAIRAVWKKYGDVNPRWAQYYASINGIASPYYIPNDLWSTRVCRVLNSKERFGWPLFQDKNYTDVLYPGIRQPEVLVRNVSGQFLDASFCPLSLEEAAAVCEKAGEFIVKPSVETKGGKGIEFFDFSSGQAGERSLSEILSSRGGDFVVQKVLRQHHKMAELNPDSINTVRVMTLLWKGQSRVLGALVRIGTKGCRVDNPHTSNGFSCVLDEEGKMVDKAYDRDWHPYTELPNGMAVKGFTVPYYDRIVDTVLKLHYRMPHFRVIGWDMTVSEEGEPIMIEANLSSPEIYFHQLGGGPLIQDPELFDEIMRYVTQK